MRWLKRAALIPYYLVLFVAFITWITVACPLAFLTDCSVTNQTGATLAVTPIGTVGIDGHRTLLPLYRTSFPYFAKSKRGDFDIAPNETFDFSYDMDDVNFSEIFVEIPGVATGQIVVNPNPTNPQYVVPGQTDFIIDNFNALPPVPLTVGNAAALGQKPGRMWLIYTVFAILLIVECLRIRLATRKRTAEIAG